MKATAISLHQMPDGPYWKRLHARDSPSDLIDKYISTINKPIVSDDEIAAAIDDIKCMVSEARFQENMGRPRRAWREILRCNISTRLFPPQAVIVFL